MRNGAGAGNVFGRLVAGAQGAVHEARTVANKNHRQLVVGHVQFDLLYHPHRDEGGQAIHKGPKTRARQACGHAHHVLLGNARVDVLRGAVFAKVIKQRIAVVAGEQQHLGVGLGQAHQRGGKGGSHAAPLFALTEVPALTAASAWA